MEPRPTPLDPKVHFIAGFLIAAVSAYSLLFTDMENKAVMNLFLIIGLGFIAIGFIKKLIRYIKSGGLKKDEEALGDKIIGKVPQDKVDADYQEQVRRQAQLKNQGQPQVVVCRLCGARNYSTSNYCHMCGSKLR